MFAKFFSAQPCVSPPAQRDKGADTRVTEAMRRDTVDVGSSYLFSVNPCKRPPAKARVQLSKEQ